MCLIFTVVLVVVAIVINGIYSISDEIMMAMMVMLVVLDY